MSSPAISFLNGRTLPESFRPAPRRRRGHSLLHEGRRHLARKRYVAARREHDRQDTGDAYLDRTGFEALDWGDQLARHVAR